MQNVRHICETLMSLFWTIVVSNQYNFKGMTFKDPSTYISIVSGKVVMFFL